MPDMTDIKSGQVRFEKVANTSDSVRRLLLGRKHSNRSARPMLLDTVRRPPSSMAGFEFKGVAG
jgi:hypothetical protein